MNNVIKSMKNQFAESQSIINAVGDNCLFLVSLQDITTYPIIVYNVKENFIETKDNLREYDLTIFILAESVKNLMDIYEVSKTVMDQETTDFFSTFQGSSYAEPLEDKDDTYIVDINYRIQQVQQ